MYSLVSHIMKRSVRFNVVGAALAIVTLGMGVTGCVSSREGTLRPQPEHGLTGGGNADDHRAATALYAREALRLETDASRYEQQAEALSRQWMDPKGFRRGGLLTLAAKNRKEVAELRVLAAMHQTKVQEMMGKHPSQ